MDMQNKTVFDTVKCITRFLDSIFNQHHLSAVVCVCVCVCVCACGCVCVCVGVCVCVCVSINMIYTVWVSKSRQHMSDLIVTHWYIWYSDRKTWSYYLLIFCLVSVPVKYCQ